MQSRNVSSGEQVRIDVAPELQFRTENSSVQRSAATRLPSQQRKDDGRIDDEPPITLPCELGDRHGHARHRRGHQHHEPDGEQDARQPRLRQGKRQEEARGKTHRAHAGAHREDAAECHLRAAGSLFGHRAPTNIMTATTNSTSASSSRSHRPPIAGRRAHSQKRSDLHSDHRCGGKARHEDSVTVVDDGAGGGGHADHEGAGRGRRAHRDAAPRGQHRHLDEAPAHSQQGRYVARHERRRQGERQPLEAVGHRASEPLVVILPAERARVPVALDDHVRVAQAHQRDDPGEHGDPREQYAQRGWRKHLGGDAPEETTRRCCDFQQHSKPQVDHPPSSAGCGDRAGRGNDGRETDGCGRLEGHPRHQHQEGNEEYAATQAEQGAEQAGDTAKRHGGEHEDRRENGHRFHDGRSGRPHLSRGLTSCLILPPERVSS